MSEIEIKTVNAYDLFKTNFYEYGMAVIKERALPDIRDGLKPVHRAIVFEMLKSHATSKDKTKKVKKITGSVIGNWHPHGDIAVEDAMVGLAELWTNTLPIVEIKGNGGSIFGDRAASGRYIEARLTPSGDAYGHNLKKGVVPYVKNFDDTDWMPTILPAQLPYLLINGISEGIAVGIAGSMPPHNAKEVVSMVLAYLKNPKLKTEQLLEYMPGPDFPSGATIINKDDLPEIYETGTGKIRVRATLEYDKKEHALHVREIPYLFAGSMDNLVAELAAATTETLDKKKKRVPPKITGILDVNNYSGKDGIDICLELQKGIDPEEMKKTLFAKTRLETTVPYNFNALNNKELHTYSLRQYLKEYTEFQHEIVKKEHELEQAELNRRMEIIMGRLIAAKYIDEIVDSIKNSESRKQVIDMLMHGTILPGTNPRYHKTVRTFHFTEIQAEAIADQPTYRLSKMNTEELKTEGLQVKERLVIVDRMVSDDAFRHKEIIRRLKEEYKKLPDTPRKTRIISDQVSKVSAVEVPTVTLYTAIDKYGYVRIEGKPFEQSLVTDNKSRLGFFDKDGTCWNLFLDKAKETKDRGTLVSFLVPAENPVIGMTAGIGKENAQGLFLFENGALRRVEMNKYMTKTRATKVNTQTAGHPLKAFYDIPDNVNMVSIDGRDIPLENIPLQGRSGSGKQFLEPKEEPYAVEFKQGEITKYAKPKGNAQDVFDAVATFTEDGQLLFDWTTTDTTGRDGLYVTTYQQLLKDTLLFVHSDGTAKKVKGEQFTVKTKRSQIEANKKGTKAIYIHPTTETTLIGNYADGKQKRIEVAKISEQGKTGGGVRVFYSTKYEFQSVESGEGSDLPIVSFATQPK